MNRMDTITARLDRARTGGAKTLWYMVAMDTLLDLFLEKDTVTRDELKQELARRRDRHADIDILRGGYEEAIAQLTDPIEPPVE